ncbi:hypothetical protein FGO68_gene5525 [Halteria grandinella]|uniref:inositol-1,3,4-trisphosphate 5/6-kinase n=1 Tax=Halteria grandinella TaxID=5974 RepID=A0A8J8NE20_HALGN|nr:hypothetical protein FGO68_gene5525 [Halteria grandinella]
MKTGLLDNDEEFSFIPLNLDQGFDLWGKVDVVVQKLQSIVPVYTSEESQLKIASLLHYLQANKTPIIDSPVDAMVVQNRLLFLRNLKSAVEHLHLKHPDNQDIQRLRCPKFFDFIMPTQHTEESLSHAHAQILLSMELHSLPFPFVIKLLQASRTTHAHSFFVVTTEGGLREALKFEGFQGEHLLIQEWVEHHEQLYKLYCCGPKHFDWVIKTSIPIKLVTSAENGAFFFQTRMKFLPESFTSFTTEQRIPEPIFELITREVGVGYFNLNLFGVDILIEEGSGHVYLIDINYFSSYDGLKRMNVREAFRDLIRSKVPKHGEGSLGGAGEQK